MRPRANWPGVQAPTDPSRLSLASQTLGVRRRLTTRAARCLPSGRVYGRPTRFSGPERTALLIME